MKIKIEPHRRPMTVREKQVKKLLDMGYTPRQIARELTMAIYLVEATVHEIRAWESVQEQDKMKKG